MPGQEAGGNPAGAAGLPSLRWTLLACWSAGERGRFEIKEPFLECGDAVPTTEPKLKGNQAAEKCAPVSPGKAPSVIKTNPPRMQKPAVKAQKPAAKAKASAPSKTQADVWPPWRSTASVLKVAFLVAL